MPVIDIIILVILLLFALAGVRRGLLWELFTAIGLVLGFLLVYTFRADLQDLVIRLTDARWQREWLSVILFLAAFLTVYLGFAAIGRAIHNRLEKTPFKWPDRVLGVVAGIAKGVVLIALLVIAADWFDREGHVRTLLDKSKLVRWGKVAVYNMTHWESDEKKDLVQNDGSRSEADEGFGVKRRIES